MMRSQHFQTFIESLDEVGKGPARKDLLSSSYLLLQVIYCYVNNSVQLCFFCSSSTHAGKVDLKEQDVYGREQKEAHCVPERQEQRGRQS